MGELNLEAAKAAMADALATARKSGKWDDAKRAISAAEAAVAPCPFCREPHPRVICTQVFCSSCGASGPKLEGSLTGPHETDYRISDGDVRQYRTICEGVRLWNARSEAQPSGYDGSKSLGERLYEAFWERAGHEVVPFSEAAQAIQMMWKNIERDALTFTASLSDASPSSGDE